MVWLCGRCCSSSSSLCVCVWSTSLHRCWWSVLYCMLSLRCSTRSLPQWKVTLQQSVMVCVSWGILVSTLCCGCGHSSLFWTTSHLHHSMSLSSGPLEVCWGQWSSMHSWTLYSMVAFWCALPCPHRSLQGEPSLPQLVCQCTWTHCPLPQCRHHSGYPSLCVGGLGIEGLPPSSCCLCGHCSDHCGVCWVHILWVCGCSTRGQARENREEEETAAASSMWWLTQDSWRETSTGGS